jgi:hypothetical protein
MTLPNQEESHALYDLFSGPDVAHSGVLAPETGSTATPAGGIARATPTQIKGRSMSDGSDGVSAAQLASGAAQTYMNNAQQYATQASSSAATASSAAASAAGIAELFATQSAGIMALITGDAPGVQTFEDNDILTIVRNGKLYSVPYAAVLAVFEALFLQVTNNLDDVPEPATALNNLGGVSKSSIKSSLVANTSSSETVSTSFSFTPGTDGVLTILSQGGSGGTNAVSVGLDIGVTQMVGATLLTNQQNNNGSFNLGIFNAQFSVKAGVAVNLTVTQTAPTGTTSNQLSSLFIYLPS